MNVMLVQSTAGWSTGVSHCFTTTNVHCRVQKNPFFLKKSPTHWVFGVSVFIGFLDERALGSLLVDLAHQLSFYLDLKVL